MDVLVRTSPLLIRISFYEQHGPPSTYSSLKTLSSSFCGKWFLFFFGLNRQFRSLTKREDTVSVWNLLGFSLSRSPLPLFLLFFLLLFLLFHLLFHISSSYSHLSSVFPSDTHHTDDGDLFILTSNEDGFFEASGFDPFHLCEIHGSLKVS
jgi:hypothetical protein